MRRFVAVLMLLMVGSGEARDRRCRPTRAGQRMVDSCVSAAATSLVALCDALQAGDKAGAWECMKGDGTMAAGSATTFVATGTPTNTTENGWPVRTYTTAQNDQQPSNAAFPATDFTVCTHHRSTALTNTQLTAFGTSGAAAAVVSIPFEQQTNGTFISYISNGAAATNFASSSAPLPAVAGGWYLICYAYTRVGGAANNVGTLTVNGVQVGTSSAQNLAQGLSSVWSTNGYAAAGAPATAGSVRGFFVTYKALSVADTARLYAAVGP